MNEALQVLLTDGVIDEVVGRLKSGKEADVYLVRHGGEVVAAKIYKEREHRNFRNNSGYREGRQVRNSRTARAIAKGSRFGVAAAEEAWKTAEVEALFKLHAAGVCVPRPVIFYEGVLLMELVLDPDGQPAPRLEEAMLTPDEASALYFDLRNQAIRMLCCDLIHGDLSAFNILLGARGATIIDLPQVVDAAANSQAERYFTRDLENLRIYFEATDSRLRARAGDAHEIWRAYTRRELTPDFEPTGRFQPGPNERLQNRRPPSGNRPPGNRPPGNRPPGNRPPGDRPPGDRPPGDRPPRREGEQRPWREQNARSGGPPPPRSPPQQEAREQNARSGGPPGPRSQEPRGERPPRGDRPRNERSFRGGADGARQAANPGGRNPEPTGGPGPRSRPPERRSDGGGRSPRQGRGGGGGGGGGGPQVSYVQKGPAAPSAPPKPDEPS